MTTILHLAPADRWQGWPEGAPYLPAEYSRDGFIHLTDDPGVMLEVANRFYRQAPGAFVMLEVDVDRLTAELRWEPGSHGEARLFPHLYGPLNPSAVLAVHPVRRSEDGAFLGW